MDQEKVLSTDGFRIPVYQQLPSGEDLKMGISVRASYDQ